VIFYFQRHLHRILSDLCGKEDRARFWLAFSNVILVLVPMAAVLLGRESVQPNESPMLYVADHLKWAVVGVIFAVLLVGAGLAAFILQGQAGPARRSSRRDEPRRRGASVEEALPLEGSDRSPESGTQQR